MHSHLCLSLETVFLSIQYSENSLSAVSLRAHKPINLPHRFRVNNSPAPIPEEVITVLMCGLEGSLPESYHVIHLGRGEEPSSQPLGSCARPPAPSTGKCLPLFLECPCWSCLHVLHSTFLPSPGSESSWSLGRRSGAPPSSLCILL